GGVDVSRNPEGVKQRIGYMSQKFSLYELLSVDQNIRFFGAMYGLTDAQIAARRTFVLEMAGLKGRENTKARELAGGWRQRLALAVLAPHRGSRAIGRHHSCDHALPGRGRALPSHRHHQRRQAGGDWHLPRAEADLRGPAHRGDSLEPSGGRDEGARSDGCGP